MKNLRFKLILVLTLILLAIVATSCTSKSENAQQNRLNSSTQNEEIESFKMDEAAHNAGYTFRTLNGRKILDIKNGYTIKHKVEYNAVIYSLYYNNKYTGAYVQHSECSSIEDIIAKLKDTSETAFIF